MQSQDLVSDNSSPTNENQGDGVQTAPSNDQSTADNFGTVQESSPTLSTSTQVLQTVADVDQTQSFSSGDDATKDRAQMDELSTMVEATPVQVSSPNDTRAPFSTNEEEKPPTDQLGEQWKEITSQIQKIEPLLSRVNQTMREQSEHFGKLREFLERHKQQVPPNPQNGSQSHEPLASTTSKHTQSSNTETSSPDNTLRSMSVQDSGPDDTRAPFSNNEQEMLLNTHVQQIEQRLDRFEQRTREQFEKFGKQNERFVKLLEKYEQQVLPNPQSGSQLCELSMMSPSASGSSKHTQDTNRDTTSADNTARSMSVQGSGPNNTRAPLSNNEQEMPPTGQTGEELTISTSQLCLFEWLVVTLEKQITGKRSTESTSQVPNFQQLLVRFEQSVAQLFLLLDSLDQYVQLNCAPKESELGEQSMPLAGSTSKHPHRHTRGTNTDTTSVDDTARSMSVQDSGPNDNPAPLSNNEQELPPTGQMGEQLTILTSDLNHFEYLIVILEKQVIGKRSTVSTSQAPNFQQLLVRFEQSVAKLFLLLESLDQYVQLNCVPKESELGEQPMPLAGSTSMPVNESGQEMPSTGQLEEQSMIPTSQVHLFGRLIATFEQVMGNQSTVSTSQVPYFEQLLVRFGQLVAQLVKDRFDQVALNYARECEQSMPHAGSTSKRTDRYTWGTNAETTSVDNTARSMSTQDDSFNNTNARVLTEGQKLQHPNISSLVQSLESLGSCHRPLCSLLPPPGSLTNDLQNESSKYKSVNVEQPTSTSCRSVPTASILKPSPPAQANDSVTGNVEASRAATIPIWVRRRSYSATAWRYDVYCRRVHVACYNLERRVTFPLLVSPPGFRPLGTTLHKEAAILGTDQEKYNDSWIHKSVSQEELEDNGILIPSDAEEGGLGTKESGKERPRSHSTSFLPPPADERQIPISNSVLFDSLPVSERPQHKLKSMKSSTTAGPVTSSPTNDLRNICSEHKEKAIPLEAQQQSPRKRHSGLASEGDLSSNDSQQLRVRPFRSLDKLISQIQNHYLRLREQTHTTLPEALSSSNKSSGDDNPLSSNNSLETVEEEQIPTYGSVLFGNDSLPVSERPQHKLKSMKSSTTAGPVTSSPTNDLRNISSEHKEKAIPLEAQQQSPWKRHFGLASEGDLSSNDSQQLRVRPFRSLDELISQIQNHYLRLREQTHTTPPEALSSSNKPSGNKKPLSSNNSLVTEYQSSSGLGKCIHLVSPTCSTTTATMTSSTYTWSPTCGKEQKMAQADIGEQSVVSAGLSLADGSDHTQPAVEAISDEQPTIPEDLIPASGTSEPNTETSSSFPSVSKGDVDKPRQSKPKSWRKKGKR